MWSVNYDHAGFSSPLVSGIIPQYKIVTAATGDYLHGPFPAGGTYDASRTLLMRLLGVINTHDIEPVAADGKCAFGACDNGNTFLGQMMGEEMVAMRAAGNTWLQHDLILNDWHTPGKHNGTDDEGNCIVPVLVLKLYISCDAVVPMATVHLLVSGGMIPVTAQITVKEAMRKVHDSEDPILVIYEIENHPQVGGQYGGRHFEVMVPKPAFLAQKRVAETSKKRQGKRHDKFEEDQKALYEKAKKPRSMEHKA